MKTTLLVLFASFSMIAHSQTGQISFSLNNTGEYEKYICEKTYFQLVEYPKNGFGSLSHVIVKTSEYKDTLVSVFKTMNIDSELPKVNYSSGSQYKINIDKLKPGKYFIAVQNVPLKASGFIKEADGNQIKIIELDKKNKGTKIDLGSVALFIDLKTTYKW